MRTLLLDVVAWDLVADARGDIAAAAAPYALAQDAASAIKLFQGELWFNTAPGVPYQFILGRSPPVAYLKATFETAALTVPGVVAARCFITDITDREVHGQVQVTDQAGKISAAGF